ncbi:MAG: hypothetical protein Q9169_007098 [Polycauliona sp. 2 TL-2023]
MTILPSDTDNDNTTITLTQLNKHDNQDDLWIAVHGKDSPADRMSKTTVYNLTTFLPDHPGGSDALLGSAGVDGTEVYEYAGHSAQNMKTMQRFLVGWLEGYVATAAEDDDGGGGGSGGEEEKKKGGSEGVAMMWWRMSLSSSSAAAAFVCVFIFLLLLCFGAWSAPGGITGTTPASLLSPFTFLNPLHHPLNFLLNFLPSYPLPSSLIPNSQPTTTAFLLGLLLASSIALAVLGRLYAVFCKTLEVEKGVFDYPAVVPRGGRGG